jgi:hypothetical protein
MRVDDAHRVGDVFAGTCYAETSRGEPSGRVTLADVMPDAPGVLHRLRMGQSNAVERLEPSERRNSLAFPRNGEHALERLCHVGSPGRSAFAGRGVRHGSSGRFDVGEDDRFEHWARSAFDLRQHLDQEAPPAFE